MFRRNGAKTRGQLLRAELGESWDHALRAAGHAAGGVKTTLGPKVAPTADRVRGAAVQRWGSTKSALAPLSEAARAKVKNGRKEGMLARHWPKLAGLLAGGAAVGAAAAYALRRRRRQQWEEYEAEPEAIETTPGAGSGPAATPSEGTSQPSGAEPGRSDDGVTGSEPRSPETVDVPVSKNSRG